MSNNILSQAPQLGESHPAAEHTNHNNIMNGFTPAAAATELHFTRDSAGLIALSPYSHHHFTRDEIIPFLSRELRQALARLATYDTQEAYQAALSINIELAELASDLRDGAK